MDMALINAKGFGGNNASALMLSPSVTQAMLEKRHGKAVMQKHAGKLEETLQASAQHEDQFLSGSFKLTYQFGEQVLEGEELTLTDDSLEIPGYSQKVNLNLRNPFTDMFE